MIEHSHSPLPIQTNFSGVIVCVSRQGMCFCTCRPPQRCYLVAFCNHRAPVQLANTTDIWTRELFVCFHLTVNKSSHLTAPQVQFNLMSLTIVCEQIKCVFLYTRGSNHDSQLHFVTTEHQCDLPVLLMYQLESCWFVTSCKHLHIYRRHSNSLTFC